MPLLIVLTSDSIAIQSHPSAKQVVLGRFLKMKIPVCTAYLLLMAGIFVCVFVLHLHLQSAPWLHALSALSLAALLVQPV